MAVVVGFVGYANSGKTTVIANVLLVLKKKGYQVAVIKHDAHGHYKEAPHTDSSLFIGEGADTVVTVSPGYIHRFEKKAAEDLAAIITSLEAMDYILIEGFKMESYPQIAVFRNEEQSRIIHNLKSAPLAIATNMNYESSNIRVLSLDDAESIALFIEKV
ncbi:molybdopterin-guanine dinucleotide biosynthesis protein B [Paenibacillus eucommiae]|uniref:Molybdopterin-guanine dinucleotide biosynthesis protein B n=1 Tax=Paenibacillus eucommiae TaxID=1355755 RepID=A0ABS4INW2_9BACL|nr:molybdopterin-guanine dinucleotide biosynthesis protein B [Paenibacillus eucommiae]MBP1989244.1 molybdopterin-guanine dinucleotide biosynthesis protein B [Paenibacillus eucommiae]